MTSHRLAETALPAAAPLSLPETRAHLRVDADTDNALIAGLIATACGLCEAYTGRALIARTYSLYLDHWPDNGIVALPRPPLLAVSGIWLHAENGGSQTYPQENYFVDTAGVAGRVILKAGASPPYAGRVSSGIEIRFQAGYGVAAESVPPLLRQGMLQLIAYLYMHRGDDPSVAVQASGAAFLFQSYRVMSL